MTPYEFGQLVGQPGALEKVASFQSAAGTALQRVGRRVMAFGNRHLINGGSALASHLISDSPSAALRTGTQIGRDALRNPMSMLSFSRSPLRQLGAAANRQSAFGHVVQGVGQTMRDFGTRLV